MSTKKMTKAVKGTMTFHDGDRLTFTPYGKGEAQYETLKKTTGGALMKTVGEKTQSLVARLKVPATAEDPAADLRDQLERVIRELPGVEAPPPPRGRILRNADGLTVSVDYGQETIGITMIIDLATTKDVMGKYLKMSMEATKCLQYNSDSLKRR